jgi:hypothetical protein
MRPGIGGHVTHTQGVAPGVDECLLLGQLRQSAEPMAVLNIAPVGGTRGRGQNSSPHPRPRAAVA